ncbi:MAG: 50S ribosomal protein L30 [Gammaproteobacteria bacterium]|nr:50S ribosomal protein L30 [Gammaproteobacteria bacterium]
MTKTGKLLRVTLVKSVIASKPDHKKCVKGLGLGKTNSMVLLQDTPCNRGMINKVTHLLSVEEAQ